MNVTSKRTRNLDNFRESKMTNEQLVAFLSSTRKIKSSIDEALKEVLELPQETTEEE